MSTVFNQNIPLSVQHSYIFRNMLDVADYIFHYEA